jgi:hypothetical protein
MPRSVELPSRVRDRCSVAGRPIVAYHLGDPRSRVKALIVGQMHGDEHAVRFVK